MVQYYVCWEKSLASTKNISGPDKTPCSQTPAVGHYGHNKLLSKHIWIFS